MALVLKCCLISNGVALRLHRFYFVAFCNVLLECFFHFFGAEFVQDTDDAVVDVQKLYPSAVNISRHTDTTSFPFLPENKNLSRVFDRFAAYALDRTLFRVCFTPEIEKALAFRKFSGRFWSICRSVTAFESKGYVFVFSYTPTPKWSVWGRKRPLTFHRGAGVSTVNLLIFSCCVQFDKLEFIIKKQK